MTARLCTVIITDHPDITKAKDLARWTHQHQEEVAKYEAVIEKNPHITTSDIIKCGTLHQALLASSRAR